MPKKKKLEELWADLDILKQGTSPLEVELSVHKTSLWYIPFEIREFLREQPAEERAREIRRVMELEARIYDLYLTFMANWKNELKDPLRRFEMPEDSKAIIRVLNFFMLLVERLLEIHDECRCTHYIIAEMMQNEVLKDKFLSIARRADALYRELSVAYAERRREILE